MKMRPGTQTGFLLCGKEWSDGESIEVRSPWDQGLAARVTVATRAEVDRTVVCRDRTSADFISQPRFLLGGFSRGLRRCRWRLRGDWRRSRGLCRDARLAAQIAAPPSWPCFQRESDSSQRRRCCRRSRTAGCYRPKYRGRGQTRWRARSCLPMRGSRFLRA